MLTSDHLEAGRHIERKLRMTFSKIFLTPLIALAVAIPIATTSNVSTADARHKNHKRAAIIAGAIIGGAIIYNHHKRKKYRRHYRKSYGHGHYRSGHRYGHRYGHRSRYGYRYGKRYGHRYGHRHGYGYRGGGYGSRWRK